MNKASRPMVVARAILRGGNGCILLGQRSDTLLWECPGGKVEDERCVEAAVRELFEETGVLVAHEGDGTAGPFFVGYGEARSVKNPDRRCIDLFYLWRRWSGLPRLMEGAHKEWRWFGHDELPFAELLMPTTRQVLGLALPTWLASHGMGLAPLVRSQPVDEVELVSLGPVS